MNIRLDCRGGASPAGQELEVVVGWKDDKTPIKRRMRTDAAGQARILLEVNGVEKDSERQFDDLDRYDRELRERAEREALARESDRSGLTSASSGVALEKAKEVVTAPQTAIAIRAVPGMMLLGVEIGAAAAATGGVAIVGASTYLTYQRMKTDVERQVAKDEKAYAKGTAELKSRVGGQFDELDERGNSSAKKDAEYDAYKKRCGERPPPGLDLCARLLWELQREEDCVNMREEWDRKWGGNHAGEIANRKRAIENVRRDLKKHNCL
jgi:hypothetical protein